MRTVTKSREKPVDPSGTRSLAALGFRPHSGWATLVAVGGPLPSPAILLRQRIELADTNTPKQPYHAAEGMALQEAEKFIGHCLDQATLTARSALRTVVGDLRKRNHVVVACGILLASGRPAATLEATLASHALIHAAEGELFRNVLRRASQHYDLPITGVRERDLDVRAAADLPVSADGLRRRIVEMGQTVGAPWRQDEKHAALVAWLALAAVSH